MNGKGYDEMQRNLELFNNVSERERLFFEEFKRRQLTVPSDFRFKRDPSVFNVAYWNLVRTIMTA